MCSVFVCASANANCSLASATDKSMRTYARCGPHSLPTGELSLLTGPQHYSTHSTVASELALRLQFRVHYVCIQLQLHAALCNNSYGKINVISSYHQMITLNAWHFIACIVHCVCVKCTRYKCTAVCVFTFNTRATQCAM